jgi:hypothetical protein
MSVANLTTQEASRWLHFSNMANTQSISLIQIAPLSASALAGGIFTFSIPGVASNLQAQGRFIQQTPNGDYVWWANLSNDRGYFGIASNASGKVAYAQVDGQNYMMYLLSTQYNALVRVNSATNIIPQLCLPDLETPADITFSEDCDVDNDCPAVVSVLVMVTPEAMDWLGGNHTPLESVLYFGLGLHTVNFALLNSGVYHKSVRFIVEPYNFNFGLVPNATVDLQTFRDDPVAIGRRQLNRADLMFLITDSRYDLLLGGVLNSATGGPYVGFVSMEYLISKYYVFAHELGHTFFLNHNRESNLGDINYNGDELCAFGWRFQTSTGNISKTIMATLRAEDIQSSTRVLNYSNPNISVGGTPTGTSINFNARHASHNMCSVDDYFYDQELRVDISGPTFVCEESVTYFANITSSGAGVPGVGPYNVRWSVSSGAVPTLANPGHPLGSLNPITLYSGSLPNPVFWLFVSVVSADGVLMNDIIRVENPCGVPNPLIGGIGEMAKNETTPLNTRDFELFPNPTNQSLEVRFVGTGQDKMANYSILNTLGEIVLSGDVEIGVLNSFNIDLTSKALPDGLYYLHLGADGFNNTQKFIFKR